MPLGKNFPVDNQKGHERGLAFTNRGVQNWLFHPRHGLRDTQPDSQRVAQPWKLVDSYSQGFFCLVFFMRFALRRSWHRSQHGDFSRPSTPSKFPRSLSGMKARVGWQVIVHFPYSGSLTLHKKRLEFRTRRVKLVFERHETVSWIWVITILRQIDDPYIRFPENDRQRQAIERVRGEVWVFCSDLNDYRENPAPSHVGLLERRFDAIFIQNIGYEQGWRR